MEVCAQAAVSKFDTPRGVSLRGALYSMPLQTSVSPQYFGLKKARSGPGFLPCGSFALKSPALSVLLRLLRDEVRDGAHGVVPGAVAGVGRRLRPA